ncbi:MAG: hypothetical protein ACTHJM_15070 [Marmoricola sp.]
MRFTERELTVAVDRLAEEAFAASLPRRKRKHGDTEWQALTPIQKYGVRSTVADFAIPVLLALPDRPTVGAVPQFSDEEWAEASRSAFPEGDDAHRATAIAMGRTAVEVMPVRQDPDAIVIPDYL